MTLITESRLPADRHRRCLRLLIVDRESSTRQAISRLCRDGNAVHVVGEVESGAAAIDAAGTLRPDVMLIDVELPDMSGFEVLRASEDVARPLGIMTSNRSEHALTAFAEGAVDYLLKPVAAGRFADAIDRARRRYEVVDAFGAAAGLQRSTASDTRPKFLIGERQRRLYPIDVHKVDYIEADGNYVTIRAGGTEYISRDSVKRLSQELANHGFVRIERSILLNIRAVAFAERAGHGTLAFTLGSGTCLYSSKTYRQEILRMLPWHHSRRNADEEQGW